MQRHRKVLLRVLAIGLLIALCLAAISCGGLYRIAIRIVTTIHPDGSLTRRLAVDATSTVYSPGKQETLSSEIGITLSRPREWYYIEESPMQLRAEGFFESVELLPPTLTFDVHGTATTDRARSTLVIEERTVMRRWVYSEQHGDLFSDSEVQDALDVYIEVIAELLRSELPRHTGEVVDLTHVETFLRGELRDCIGGLVEAARKERSRYPIDRSNAAVSEVFARHGITVPIVESDGEFLVAAIPHFELWLLSRLADALTRSGLEIGPEQLRFWPPVGEEEGVELWDIWWADTAERVWGSEDLIAERMDRASTAMGGYFEAEGIRSFRFEFRVRLPGVLLTTNGTPDGEGVTWMLRDVDLTQDHILSAKSVELIDEALKALGARRSFGVGQLIELHDLLFNRDPAGELSAFLAKAVAEGNLSLLRELEQIPHGLDERSLELANLLDPAVAPPEPL